MEMVKRESAVKFMLHNKLCHAYKNSGQFMYQSIPSLTIPRENPGEVFERANSPSPGHKESAKPRPLGQKNRAKTPFPGQLFSKIQ